MAAGIEETKTSAPRESLSPGIAKEELPGVPGVLVLEQHRNWVESKGEFGKRANLRGANLCGADLTGVNLQGALLHKANLRGADLSLADLRGAWLIQADLREANVLGAELREANLQGANLEHARGLWVGRLGGTNLFGAVLPEPISALIRPQVVRQATKRAGWVFVAMLLVNLLAWFIIARTTDVRLFKNSPALPLPLLGDAVPLVGFYLGAPLLLFAFYISFHFFLLRLWGGLAGLPAVFPDGSTLDKNGPWFVMGLVRSHFRWLRETRSPLSSVEAAISTLLAYWVVPAGLLLIWARYLTRQNLRDSMFHVFLTVATVALATILPNLAGRILRAEYFQPEESKKASKVFTLGAATLGIGLILTLLSLGIIWGVPQDSSRAPELMLTDIRRWAANAFAVTGYSPYAELTEADISLRPANWNAREEDLAQVQGARLAHASLRYAQAYRSFLVNARLWKADLQGAYLSEVDLRGANLRQANLRGAILDRARVNRAILATADLRRANLTRADLREADLSFASLEDAILADAKLGSASLYSASLQKAQLLRSNLEKADLREANLENAILALADLRGADLWFAKLPGARLKDAQLGGAILIEADLRKAELRGANLQGAILRGADLDGANLDGADLRGAFGLTAAQICSSMSRRAVLLEQDLQHAVDGRCGPVR